MKTVYLECSMGAAGDMLLAALLELLDDRRGFLDRLNAVGIPGVVVTAEPSVKRGITGTRARVLIDGREEESCNHEHTNDHNGRNADRYDDYHHHHDHHHHNNHHHSHNSYRDIEHLVDHLNISQAVKQNALAIYKLIAEAESRAHGVPVDKIHFHEVGEKDAVADIVGVCMLMEELAPDVVYASPVNVGGGHVRCAHGVLPVPAPATAHILQNVPIYGCHTYGELCTPTGAAILKHFANKFCDMPTMTVSGIGYGMGKKDFERANCVRAYVGNTADRGSGENVVELICNLDDMTPEAVAFALELLLREGALDVWTLPAGMKKGRQGIILACLCHNDVREKMLTLIFKHTTTLGVRENVCRRYALRREESEIQTEYGPVRVKTSRGFGTEKSKPEYEDMARIARENGMSIDDVTRLAMSGRANR